MTAYQAGDVASFEVLMVRYERPLFAYLKRFVKDAAVADDLLQETFLRVVGTAAAWRPEAPFSSWVFAIARNLCTDHARSPVRRGVSLHAPAAPSEGDSSPILLDRVVAKGAVAERDTLDRELRSHMDRAIDELPIEQREIFLMRELMEMSIAEIVSITALSETLVRSRLRAAIEKLRGALGVFYEAAESLEAAGLQPGKTS